MTKPLLLIDVDGPLNPWDNGRVRPPGYQTFRFPLRGCHPIKPQRVWLRPEHGDWLLPLAADFELTWCTAWQDQANRFVAPTLGLPQLPWIRFPGALTEWAAWVRAGWKYPQVLKYAAGRPLVWLDDSFRSKRLVETRDQFLACRENVPTSLVQVDPKLGLVKDNIKALKRWADSYAGLD